MRSINTVNRQMPGVDSALCAPQEMAANESANRGLEMQSMLYIDNPVASRCGDAAEAQTTRTYHLTEMMKFVHRRCNSGGGSAVLLL